MCGSPCPRILPVCIVALELVFELDLVGLDQADARKAYLDVLAAGFDGRTCTERPTFAFDQKIFDNDRRRERIWPLDPRIDDRHAVLRREPESALVITKACGLASAVAFGRIIPSSFP